MNLIFKLFFDGKDPRDDLLVHWNKGTTGFFWTLLSFWLAAFTLLRILVHLNVHYFQESFHIFSVTFDYCIFIFGQEQDTYFLFVLFLYVVSFPFFWLFKQKKLLDILFCIFLTPIFSFMTFAFGRIPY